MYSLWKDLERELSVKTMNYIINAYQTEISLLFEEWNVDPRGRDIKIKRERSKLKP